MKRGIVALLLVSSSLSAQKITDAELVHRIQANSTRYECLENGTDLRALANAQGTDILRNMVTSEVESLCSGCATPDDTDHWRIEAAVKASDLVAIGSIVRKTSALTAKHGFVFTDSEFFVDEVWKTRSKKTSAGTEVTITTAGGGVTLDGHHIRASLSGFKEFTVGHRYLLFLHYLPESASYAPTDVFGFDVTGPNVVAMQTNIATPGYEYLSNLTNFLAAMRSSADHPLAEDAK